MVTPPYRRCLIINDSEQNIAQKKPISSGGIPFPGSQNKTP
jgi:hypothetical protein